MSGYCVWRGTITFTGSWATPTTNISRDRYMVFAKWSADNVTIEFDGSNIIATKDHAGLDQDATVTMQIAIFASGVSPTPGRGLNIIRVVSACSPPRAGRLSTGTRPTRRHGEIPILVIA
jgi:hypothetical protein